jgi:hypothetical protein
MPRSSTTLKEGDNLPARGKSNKTRVLDALRSESVKDLLELPTKPTRDQAEEAFFARVAQRALNSGDPNSAMLLKVLMDKGWSSPKPTLEPIKIDFPVNGTPAEKSFAVLESIADGGIAPDIGQLLIGIIKDSVIIEEATDLKQRIEALENA